MYQKLLAAIGIGAAKVDTILNTENLEPGGKIEASIHVRGGDIEQRIDAIYLTLCTYAKKDDEGHPSYEYIKLRSWQLNQPFLLSPHENKSFNFKGTIPLETPISEFPVRLQLSKTLLRTGLDIDSALDPKDVDPIKIAPITAQKTIFAACKQLGLRPLKSETDTGYILVNGKKSHYGIFQEITYVIPGKSYIPENLLFSFLLDEEYCHVLIEQDRFTDKGPYNHLKFDKQESDVSKVAQQIKEHL